MHYITRIATAAAMLLAIRIIFSEKLDCFSGIRPVTSIDPGNNAHKPALTQYYLQSFQIFHGDTVSPHNDGQPARRIAGPVTINN
jgi:hypothetical protein